MAVDRGVMTGRIGWEWLVALMVANTVVAVGLFGDIARHLDQPHLLTDRDVVTGWHLVLYGGVVAVVGVLGALALTEGPQAPARLLPPAVAGVAALCAGSVADAVWHQVYGPEAAFQALVSPPHLLALSGLVLLMVAPVAAVARGPNRPLDGVRSLVLALSVSSLLLAVSLFTGYLTPLVGASRFQAGAYIDPLVGTSVVDYSVSRGLGVALWFSVVVSGTVVVVRSRTAPVAGTWTVAFGVLGLGPLVISGTAAVPLTVALLAYGLASDFTATRSRPHPVLTGLAVAFMWTALFATVSWRGDLAWVRELWAGVITTGFLVGAAVGHLLRWVGQPVRDRPTPP